MLALHASRMAQRAAPRQADLAAAFQVNASQASRWCAGEKFGPFFQLARVIYALTRGDEVTVYGVLTEAEILARRIGLMFRSVEWLLARYREQEEAEAAAVAKAAEALWHKNRAAHRQAIRELAAIHRTMVALDEEMHSRPGQPDPRSWAQR